MLTRFAAEVIGLISAAVSAEVVVLKNLFLTVVAGNYHFSCPLIGEGGSESICNFFMIASLWHLSQRKYVPQEMRYSLLPCNT